MAIKHETFFPYKFDERGLVLDVVHLEIDGSSFNNYINSPDKEISIYSHDDWTKAKLVFDLTASKNIAASVLADDELHTLPWVPIITISCPYTRKRKVLSLKVNPKNKYNWIGEVSIGHDEYYKRIDLRAFLIRSKDYLGNDVNIAKKRGMRIASSEDWNIFVDSPVLPPGKMLDIRWINFQKSKDNTIREVSGTPFYLDFRRDTPILWLNEGVADLKAVLMSSATRGAIATIRNSIFDSISQTVWCGLFNEALMSIEDDDSGGEPAEPPEEWQKIILKRMAPRIFIGRNSDEAYEELLKSAYDPDMSPVISSRLITSVLNFLAVTKNLSSLMKMVELE